MGYRFGGCGDVGGLFFFLGMETLEIPKREGGVRREEEREGFRC